MDTQVCELPTCDVGGEPAAGLFRCKTFGDILSRAQDLQRHDREHAQHVCNHGHCQLLQYVVYIFLPLDKKWKKKSFHTSLTKLVRGINCSHTLRRSCHITTRGRKT